MHVSSGGKENVKGHLNAIMSWGSLWTTDKGLNEYI